MIRQKLKQVLYNHFVKYRTGMKQVLWCLVYFFFQYIHHGHACSNPSLPKQDFQTPQIHTTAFTKALSSFYFRMPQIWDKAKCNDERYLLSSLHVQEDCCKRRATAEWHRAEEGRWLLTDRQTDRRPQHKPDTAVFATQSCTWHPGERRWFTCSIFTDPFSASLFLLWTRSRNLD